MNRKLKALILSTAAATMLTAVSVSAEAVAEEPVTVTTEDGLLTITLPNEDWVEVPSETNTVVFSDGDCAILFDIYRSDDTLPGYTKKDDKHVVVYNAAAMTEDYVFIATGLITTEEDYNDIRSAIDGIEVDQEKITDEMLDHTLNVDVFSIEEVSYPAWVTVNELNVRNDSSTEGAVLAVVKKGTEVEVTGIVKKNGGDIGWSRIKINGQAGYVSSQFLTKTKPEPTKEPEKKPEENKPAEETPSAEVDKSYPFTVYYPDATPFELYLDNEAYAHDADGVPFEQGADGVWRNEQYGVYFYRDNLGYQHPFTVYYPDGTEYELYLESEGWAHDITGTQFEQDQDGTWKNEEFGVYFLPEI